MPTDRASRERGSVARPWQVYLDRLHRRLQGAPSRSRDARLSIARELPGLFELVESLSAAAVNEVDASKRPVVCEWNPFYQRVYLLSAEELRDDPLTRHLDRAADTIDRFIDVSHQASHVLLLEPLFVGRATAPTAEQFVTTSLVCEGYCFWYADIVVTRRLRVRLADGELVRARSSFSQPLFHPYRAFQAVGLEDEAKILDVYLRAFAGEKSALFYKKHLPLVHELFHRFARFYFGSQKGVRDLKRELDRQDVFGEFRRRFCLVPGLPSLLPESILKIDVHEDPHAFCLAVARSGLAWIGSLAPAVLQRVRARRVVQSRAYAAYSLRAVLRDGTFTVAGPGAGKRPQPRRDLLLSCLEEYLSRLEAAIVALARGAPLRQVESLREEADAFYTAQILARLRRTPLWVSERKMVLPYMKLPFGVVREPSRLSRRDRAVLTRHVLKLASRVYLEAPNPPADGLRQMAALLDAAAAPGDAGRHDAAWARAYNALLCAPRLIDTWSVRLDAIDPAENRFRELRFSIL
jgi:hypothetical protein